jgi:hypothetical protein
MLETRARKGIMKNIARLLTLAVLVAGFATYASANTLWNAEAFFKYNSLTGGLFGSATGIFGFALLRRRRVQTT